MDMTATQIARELDISRSYLYYLKNNGAFQVGRSRRRRNRRNPIKPSISTTAAIWETSTSCWISSGPL